MHVGVNQVHELLSVSKKHPADQDVTYNFQYRRVDLAPCLVVRNILTHLMFSGLYTNIIILLEMKLLCKLI